MIRLHMAQCKATCQASALAVPVLLLTWVNGWNYSLDRKVLSLVQGFSELLDLLPYFRAGQHRGITLNPRL